MQAAANQQAALESGLREGLAARRFVLFCQPQFSRTGRLVGAEVLVRWDRGDGLLLGPDSFIALAESTGVFAENVAETVEGMRALCALGLQFSLDDFGTGYSSLAYLRRFPLSALKIDRSFVYDVHVDPDAVPIVEAIIALARTLRLEIVAEGVEHEAQRSFLVGGGCEALQGYLLGPPVPIAEFERIHGG